MKAKVRILVNGIAGTVLTGAIAGGLVLSSSGAFSVKKAELSSDETVSKLNEDSSEESAELVGADRFQLGNLWDEKNAIESITGTETEASEKQQTAAGKAEASGSDEEAATSTSDLLREFFADKGLVNPEAISNCLNVHSEADELAKTVAVLAANTPVRIILTSGEWSNIEADGSEGWVRTDFLLTGDRAADYVLKNGDPYARVTADNMNMRLRASTDSDILAVVYKDDVYEIGYAQDGWVYVTYEEDIKGFLSGEYINLTYFLGDIRIDTDISIDEEAAKSLRLPDSIQAGKDFRQELLDSEPLDLSDETDTYAELEYDTETDEIAYQYETAMSSEAVYSNDDTLAALPDMTEYIPESAEDIESESEPYLPSLSDLLESSAPETGEDLVSYDTAADTSLESETQTQAQPEEAEPIVPEMPETDFSPEAGTTSSEAEPVVPESEYAAPETEPETSTEISLTGVDAYYRGAAKQVGDVVMRSEIYIVAGYSDGSFKSYDEGWTSDDVGMMLADGPNVLHISFGGFTSDVIVEASAAITTEPTTASAESSSETQPSSEVSTQPSEEATTAPAAETVTEATTEATTAATTEETTEATTAATTEETTQAKTAVMSNCSLSSSLVSYALDLCSQYGLDYSVVFSVMYQESRFNPNATSGSGAVGLMQIIPRYSQARMEKLGVTNLYDPASNILVGIDLLAEYYYNYGSWTQALTAYRTGSPSGSSDYANLILSRVGMFQVSYQ